MSLIRDPRIHVELKELTRLRSRSTRFSLPPPIHIANRLAGRHRSRFRGRGLTFEEFREYQMGDDVKSLDWGVTIRTGTPHVRVMSEEKELSVYLVVDQRQSMYFSSQQVMKSVVCAQVAACCMWNVLEHGDRLGAFIVGETDSDFFKPQLGQQGVLRILNKLALRNQALHSGTPMDSSNDQVANALDTLIQFKTKGALIVVLSDFVDFTSDYQSKLNWLKQRNDVLAISIQDVMDKQLHQSYQLNISDGHDQLSINDLAGRQLDQYNALLSKQNQSLVKSIETQGWPLIEVGTSGDHINQFLKQIGGLGNVSK